MVNQREDSPRRPIAVGVAVLASVVVIVAAAWWLAVPAADWLARHDVGQATGTVLVNARNNARGALLTLGAGVVAAGALIFTARNFALSRRMMELTEQGQRRSFDLTEQAQVTDRYTKAVEQLGSDKPDIRIGGIYALERIAVDSARDHPTIMEVLSTFVREHSREHQPTDGNIGQPGQIDGADRKQLFKADIQAALTVLGRRNREHGSTLKIDLADAELTRANLAKADLAFAELTHANLRDANLRDANLAGTNLTGANLADADLAGANLNRANLTGANLTGATLDFATLEEAIFVRADLTHAKLKGVHSARAIYEAAKLDGAMLVNADLAGANFSAADLINASIAGATLTGARLADANLTGADFAEACLANADLVAANLTSGENLNITDFTQANLTDAIWSGKPPEGWTYQPLGGSRLRRISVIPGD